MAIVRGLPTSARKAATSTREPYIHDDFGSYPPEQQYCRSCTTGHFLVFCDIPEDTHQGEL